MTGVKWTHTICPDATISTADGERALITSDRRSWRRSLPNRPRVGIQRTHERNRSANHVAHTWRMTLTLPAGTEAFEAEQLDLWTDDPEAATTGEPGSTVPPIEWLPSPRFPW